MAQLFGLNSEKEVEIKFSFKVPSSFEEKGPDGWGYAFYRDSIWQLFKQSLDMEKILRIDTKTLTPHTVKASCFISHVRYATHGTVSYENTHPFEKILFGKSWVFAHHGHLRLYRYIINSQEFFKPEGETDSEAAFCSIMEALHELDPRQSEKEYARVIEKKARELSKQGGLNFLLSNGETMFAFYSGYRTLYYTIIRPPFSGKIEGQDDQIKFSIDAENKETPLCILSSEPLIENVNWKELELQKLTTFKNGVRVKHIYN
ncbi:MAG: class II glutamine amidotransferase [Candidatus Heimdallarchaeaceae archaeon]